jgi:hypothetical protein
VRGLISASCDPACLGKCSMMENNSEEIFFNRDHFPVLREVFPIARREIFQVAGCGCVDE